MDFSGSHVHFIGIGGVSMGALARLVELDGAIVTGSDANFDGGHNAKNITAKIDLVVINGAIADDNPELVRAKTLGIEIIGREQLLAEIEHRYVNRIAVAGSHGKSTTTAMIGAVLCAGGLDPTVHNGAMPNLTIGGREYFVTEACEFKRSFLSLSPTVAVVTNIEFDHVDCFKDFDDINATFKQFTDKAPTVFRGSEVDIKELNVTEYTRGKYSFAFENTEIRLNVVGKHNVFNAILAAKVGRHFEIPMDKIKTALENFNGIDRRFEKVGEIKSCELIIDYAHHPTEIQTTIDTVQSLYGDRFLIVFQPHTYTRTLALFDDFVRVLKTAPCVLYKTFAAREKPIKGGRAADIARNMDLRYFHTPRCLRKFITRTASKYDAIILTGAGDINKVFAPNTARKSTRKRKPKL